MKNYKHINVIGYDIPCEITKTGKPGKIEKDALAIKAILEKGIENLTHADKLALLRIYNVAYHESGKIEEIFSLDSTASNCSFCKQMRKYAETHSDCICAYCYDIGQEKYKIASLARHTLNLIIMANVEFTVEELQTLPGNGNVRVNSSGDAPNVTYAENMIKYALAHSFANVAIWSKNAFAYIKACKKYGKPGNVTMIYSSPFVNKIVPCPAYFDFVFCVFSDEKAIENALANGAGECNGKKCKECGFKCYNKAWKNSGKAVVAEILRGKLKKA